MENVLETYPQFAISFWFEKQLTYGEQIYIWSRILQRIGLFALKSFDFQSFPRIEFWVEPKRYSLTDWIMFLRDPYDRCIALAEGMAKDFSRKLKQDVTWSQYVNETKLPEEED